MDSHVFGVDSEPVLRNAVLKMIQTLYTEQDVEPEYVEGTNPSGSTFEVMATNRDGISVFLNAKKRLSGYLPSGSDFGNQIDVVVRAAGFSGDGSVPGN